MSFQNYETFPSQQGGQDGGAGPGGPPPQDAQMGGQMADNGGQYQGGNGGQPGSAGGQSQGGDEKTTLWYDFSRSFRRLCQYGDPHGSRAVTSHLMAQKELMLT